MRAGLYVPKKLCIRSFEGASKLKARMYARADTTISRCPEKDRLDIDVRSMFFRRSFGSSVLPMCLCHRLLEADRVDAVPEQCGRVGMPKLMDPEVVADRICRLHNGRHR